MPRTTRPRYNFPGVRQHIRRRGTADAAAQADTIANKLSSAHTAFSVAGADGSAALLERVDREVASASVDSLRRMANREQIVDEVFEVGEKKSRGLSRWRNVVALLPLLWTWFILWWATSAYQAELKAHDNLYVRPFLELWQQNFGGRIPITFSQAALIDAGLIGLVVWLTWHTNLAERLEEQRIRELILTFDDALGDLFGVLERNIEELLPDNANPSKWAEVTREIIREAMQGAKTLADENQRVVQTAQQTIQTMADSLTGTLQILEEGNQAFINGAIATVKTVVTEANSATAILVQTGVTPLVANLREQVQQHGQAIEGLGHNVTRLGTASETLAEKARDHTELTRAIDTRLDTMNTSLDGFTAGVVEVATRMRGAAEGVQYVLGGASRENVEQTTADILEASQGLTEATQQLARTTRLLQQVSSALTGQIVGPGPIIVQPPARRGFFRRLFGGDEQLQDAQYPPQQAQYQQPPQQAQYQPQPVDPRGRGVPGGDPQQGTPPPRN